MAGKAEIVDVPENPFRSPDDVTRITTADPVEAMLRLEIEKKRHMVELAHLRQAQIAIKHRDDPAVQAAFMTIGGASNQEERTDRPSLSVDDFLAEPHSESPPTPTKTLASQADRSKWSLKLRKLIEERYPPEGKAERIRRAREADRSYKLGQGLSLEEVRHFAEDVDLEYDV